MPNITNPAVQNRLGSKFSVSFPDFPTFTVIPKSMRLYQETGKQDVLEITYPRFNEFYLKALKTGVPLHVRWNNDKTTGEFFGYVYDATPLTQQTVMRPVVIKAIGASLGLKESQSKIWTNKTAPEIVSEIAKQAKLKAVVTAHQTRFTQQSLAGHTRWEKLQELAKRIGYVCQTINTELHFHPVDKMIDQFLGTIPIMAFLDPIANVWAEPYSQTLDMFKPKVGDYSDSRDSVRKTKVVSGIDPLTAIPYSVSTSPQNVGRSLRSTTKEPLFSEILSTTITGSQNMAHMISEAHARLARFSIYAEGSGQGDPRISPYKTIEINGTGETTDGFWVIKKVVHFVTWEGRYTVDFVCMTDGTNGNKPSATRPSSAGLVPVRNLQQELATRTTTKPSSTKLSSVKPLINQTQGGYKVTPRKWVGK